MRTISETAADLGTLKAGDRFWFWLCPTVARNEPPLCITSLAEDPAREQLEAWVAGARVGPTDFSYRGLGAVLDNGRLSFGAPGLTREVLIRLAAWVYNNVLDEPGLAKLTDAVLVDVGPDGTVRGAYQDPEFWGLAARVQLRQNATRPAGG